LPEDIYNGLPLEATLKCGSAENKASNTELETVRRGLKLLMVETHLMAIERWCADLRFPFADRLTERLMGTVQRRLAAKRTDYLIADLD